VKDVSADVDGGELVVRNNASGRVLIGVQLTFDPEPGGGCRGSNQVHTTSWLTSGLPRQFCVMAENNRCSILFHLLVPDGK